MRALINTTRNLSQYGIIQHMGISSFNLAMRRSLSTVKQQCVEILSVCEDRNSSYMQGPADAPKIIIEHLKCPSSNDHCELGFEVLSNIVIGEEVKPESNSIEDMFSKIEPAVTAILKRGNIPLNLGGDHSITFPIVKSIAKHFQKQLIIVHFDAHPDLYPSFENSASSHACPFFRILEDGNICSNLLQFGIRTMNREQLNSVRYFEDKVKVLESKDFPIHGKDILHWLQSEISQDDLVYVSIDLDVLDPAFAPGVSHREPGGLSTRQLIDAVHTIPGIIVGADVVEYNPRKDIDSMTATVAAKVVKELAGKSFLSNLASS